MFGIKACCRPIRGVYVMLHDQPFVGNFKDFSFFEKYAWYIAMDGSLLWKRIQGVDILSWDSRCGEDIWFFVKIISYHLLFFQLLQLLTVVLHHRFVIICLGTGLTMVPCVWKTTIEMHGCLFSWCLTLSMESWYPHNREKWEMSWQLMCLIFGCPNPWEDAGPSNQGWLLHCNIKLNPSLLCAWLAWTSPPIGYIFELSCWAYARFLWDFWSLLKSS